MTYFAPQNGINGSLGLTLEPSSTRGEILEPLYFQADTTGNATVGVSGRVNMNTSATLVVQILGSIRTIRDFTEGPSILRPQIQDAIVVSAESNGTVTLSRLWLDNITTTYISFSPESESNGSIAVTSTGITFDAGTYMFNASFDYPQLTQLNASSVLNAASQDLITQQPDETEALSFLSYSQKLLAGAWRFLTYFGRDSMISALLLQPVLSAGEGGAFEAVIGSVLERINKTDGSVCHEETIGDYATWLNLENNITSTASLCSYVMIDTDYYLPIVMQNYFVQTEIGKNRAADFFAQTATLPFGNEGMTYAELALLTVTKIMGIAAPFAAPGGQTQANLAHLKAGQIVGQWRDSTYGIG